MSFLNVSDAKLVISSPYLILAAKGQQFTTKRGFVQTLIAALT